MLTMIISSLVKNASNVSHSTVFFSREGYNKANLGGWRKEPALSGGLGFDSERRKESLWKWGSSIVKVMDRVLIEKPYFSR